MIKLITKAKKTTYSQRSISREWQLSLTPLLLRSHVDQEIPVHTGLEVGVGFYRPIFED